MSLDLQIKRAEPTALYRQIADQIRDRICDGHLPGGTRLPTVRRLAKEAGVTRLTVQNAYGELQSEGWIEATVGRGTFVSQITPQRASYPAFGQEATPDAVIKDIVELDQVVGIRSLASASPDPALFPADEFWQALAGLCDVSSLVAYGSSQGDPRLRVVLADWLRERAIDAGPDAILITAGATQGLSLVAQALARPGDSVLVERPTYVGFLHTLKSQGLQPVGVPMDEEGPRLDVLERILVQQRPRFFYTVPAFHNPTGLCMAPARRRELLALAARHGLLIVEDDLYGRLAYDGPPPPALKALDSNDLVLHLGSFSKIFMPGLRLGYVVAPQPLHDQLLSLRRGADLCSPPLLQRALCTFLQGGGLKRHLRRVLPVYKTRRDVMLAALQRYLPDVVDWTRPAGGFCTWLTLPRRQGFADVQQAALQQGWAFAPGEAFLPQPEAGRHLRLCFGNQPPDVIRSGVELLGTLLHERTNLDTDRLHDLQDWTPLV